jgi:hypothetical protein
VAPAALPTLLPANSLPSSWAFSIPYLQRVGGLAGHPSTDLDAGGDDARQSDREGADAPGLKELAPCGPRCPAGDQAAQERGKGLFVPPADELLKQLAVTLLVAVFGLGKVADLPQHDGHLTRQLTANLRRQTT